MLKKNDTCELLITDIGHQGEGVGKAEGYVLFVENALPGDLCLVKVLKINKSFGYGKLLEVIKPSQYRVEPPCPVAKKCGGCVLQHMSYEGQLVFKEKKVVESLKRIGGILGAESLVQPIFGMEHPFRYRNKIQIPVQAVAGEIEMGYYAKNSHRIVPWSQCLLQPEEGGLILEKIKEYMVEQGIRAYDEQRHCGIVRHVLLRYGQNGEIMACIVVNLKQGKKLPKEEELVEKLKGAGNITSVMLNYNDKNSNVIMGPTVRLLWGAPYIHCGIGPLVYQISPLSFFQVNTPQTKKLYDTVLDFGKFTKEDIVLDAYCGIGSIGLYIARLVDRVYGIEVIQDAVTDGKRNGELNGINNCYFFSGKVEDCLEEIMGKEGFRPNVIIVDPPRKGCDPQMIKTMMEVLPQRIIYVSCNPDTLARDLALLCPSYAIEKVQPVDMFPHTAHVECVVSLIRQ